ncbi:unnamed protein product [Owenia fusiformis]|uniref:Uncharacterized protein n=1 Tax=Owenia fusiformis TaxID=6347 RepID=A0A8J1TFT3_OWEFU|nr:unnamed protein product [Owenia fusiformis]
MSTKRQFKTVNEDEIQVILDSRESANTKKQIAKAERAFNDFLSQNNVREDFENLEREDICENLIEFFSGIRKGDEKYKTNSLVSFKYGITKYLAANSDIDLKNDAAFLRFRQIFDALLCQNKKDGYGSTDHKEPIEEEDIQKLYGGTT